MRKGRMRKGDGKELKTHEEELKGVDNESEMQRGGCVRYFVLACVYVYRFYVGIGMSVRVYSMLELESEKV